jgi:hypothetical protein
MTVELTTAQKRLAAAIARALVKAALAAGGAR